MFSDAGKGRIPALKGYKTGDHENMTNEEFFRLVAQCNGWDLGVVVAPTGEANTLQSLVLRFMKEQLVAPYVSHAMRLQLAAVYTEVAKNYPQGRFAPLQDRVQRTKEQQDDWVRSLDDAERARLQQDRTQERSPHRRPTTARCWSARNCRGALQGGLGSEGYEG